MNIKRYFPLQMRKYIAQMRAMDNPLQLFGRYHSGALRAYVHHTVKSNAWKQISLGIDSEVHRGTLLHCNDRRSGKSIVFGERAMVGQNSFFSAGDAIELGRDCLVGAGCNFLGAGHIYDDPTVPYARAPVVSYGSIIVEPNVWIGTGVTIIGSVRVGFGCVVAAGTFLRKTVPPLCLVAGNPARILSTYNWKNQCWQKMPPDPESHAATVVEHIASLPHAEEFAKRIDCRLNPK